MRTIVVGFLGYICLLSSFQGVSLEYAVPAQPPIQLTRQDARDILALIENQLSDLEKGNYKSAYEKYTAAPFRSVTSFDEYNYFLRSYPALGKNKSAIFGNVEINDNVASIEGTLTSLDDKSTRVVYFLIKENNEWKIIGIEPVVENKR